jgi:SAM-dependent methyltransferase
VLVQTEQTKAGEIEMRRKEAIEERGTPKLVWDRIGDSMTETILIFGNLGIVHQHSKVAEIGAGRCQRLIALCHAFNIAPTAFDISPDVLALSELMTTIPIERVAGDILETHKAFIGRFDVVFCIATVHHFPDPLPVFQAAHAMLKPGGVFYFDHEPLRSYLGLHELARWKSYLMYGRVIDREYGVLETQFTLEEWEKAWAVFPRWDIRLTYPYPILRKLINFNMKNPPRWLVKTLGGRLSGTLWKE